MMIMVMPQVDYSGEYQTTRFVKRCIFTGDTIFVGGCGRFFEGQPDEMVRAMEVALDYQDVLMFCGHEYSVGNLEFCAKVDPNNQEVKAKHAEVIALRSQNKWTVPTRIDEEMRYNVFMRSVCDETMLQLTGTQDKTSCMKFLREYKNSGNKPNL